jgi:ABC-type multidrug transport system permease subunit
MFERKGIPMVKMRSFVSNYSPMFALFAAIVGLYTMAVCIGCGIGVAV